MGIAMTFISATQGAVAGDWTGTFFPGQAVVADPGTTREAVSVVDTVAYDGTRTVVTLRSAILTAQLAALQVGLNPDGDVQAHAGRHAAGGLDPLAHADLAGVAAGTKTHAQIDAYLADVSELISGVDADLAAEVQARTIFQAAVEQTLLDQEADLAETRSALETAVSLRALAARAITTTYPVQGGGSLEADRTLTLVLAVVSELLGYGVSLTGKVVTDQILKAAVKLLISTNTTIYVATTGSDTTGTGLSGAPFASISKALASIAGMLIASSVTVTIQVADGTYTVSSTITIDHPDADKIQILGNTSAETTVAIASIDVTAKTITVAGDYVSNSDAMKNIAVGDIVGLTGSSTAGLDGAYIVSAREYTGGDTVISCVAETIAQNTVGGGSIVIKPCNRCRLEFGNFRLFDIKRLGLLKGFSISRASPGDQVALYLISPSIMYAQSLIIYNCAIGIQATFGKNVWATNVVFKNCPSFGAYVDMGGKLYCTGKMCFDGCGFGVLAYNAGLMTSESLNTTFRNVSTAYSPLTSGGNNNSCVSIA